MDRRPVTGLALRGELCAYSVGEIREQVLDIADDTIDLVLDLEDVAMLSAAALGLFVSLKDKLEAHGGRLLLQGLSPSARRVLTIGGLEPLLGANGDGSPPVSVRSHHRPSTPPDPLPELDIRNRDAGRSLDITVTLPDALTDGALRELRQRLVRIVQVRQPDELRLLLDPPGGLDGELTEVASALQEFGGTLVVPIEL